MPEAVAYAYWCLSGHSESKDKKNKLARTSQITTMALVFTRIMLFY